MSASAVIDANVAALAGTQPWSREWITPGDADAAVRLHNGRLQVAGHDGGWVPLQGRDPAAETSRWLAAAFPGDLPGSLAVGGAGHGDVLDAIAARNPGTRVVVVEPEPALLAALLAARDWRAAITGGRLAVLGAADAGLARDMWRATGQLSAAPMLVHPVLARRAPALASRARAVYERARWYSAADTRSPAVKHSMLHHDVLLALEQAASALQGSIVEIGAYVGGGTAAMGRGLRSTGHRVPFASIEPGGVYIDHPDLPSADIFGDLTSFVRAEGVSDRVTLIQGFSTAPAVLEQVDRLRGEHQIGLLCVDADGQVLRDFREYLPRCRPGALIVVDDYSSPHELSKTVPTRHGVDLAVSRRLFSPLGVYGWGTWFGTLTREVTPADLDAMALPGVA